MRQRWVGVIFLAGMAAQAPAVLAQGFQVNEHGSCVVGRAGTGAAKPCGDGSAIWYNPAGIAGMRGWTVSAGLTVITASGDFTDDFSGIATDLDNSPIPIPHLYVTYGVSDKLAAGLGVFVPYGLGTKWPVDTSLNAVELAAANAFEGRFLGYDNDLRSIYVQPTIAYKLNDKISIGAGFDFVIGSLELTQRADLSQFSVPGQTITFGNLGIPLNTDFANARLEASNATGFGGHFAVLFDPVDRIHIGARYMTRVKLDYEGDVEFTNVPTGIILPPQNPLSIALGLDPTQPFPLDLILLGANLFQPGAPLADSTVSTSITMPDQVSVGVAVDVTPALTILADWQWVHWTVFDEIVLDFDNAATPSITLPENYENTNAFRFGFDWVANPRWTVRGGFLHHDAAAPPETVTPLLPEGRRNELTAGVGINLGSTFTLDLAYQYIRQDDRRGRVRDEPINSGLYSFTAHLFGATLTARF